MKTTIYFALASIFIQAIVIQADPLSYKSLDDGQYTGGRNVDVNRTILESSPAELDVEGNWGEPQSGFQMSLRFDKREFAVGETISALLIFRNLADEQRVLTIDALAVVEFKLVIKDQQGRALPKRPLELLGPALIRNSGRWDSYDGRTQRKFLLSINTHYDLNVPGNYSVTVTREVPAGLITLGELVVTNRSPRSDGLSATEEVLRFPAPSVGSEGTAVLASGQATIRIVDALAAPGQDPTNALHSPNNLAVAQSRSNLAFSLIPSVPSETKTTRHTTTPLPATSSPPIGDIPPAVILPEPLVSNSGTSGRVFLFSVPVLVLVGALAVLLFRRRKRQVSLPAATVSPSAPRAPFR